MNEAQKQIAKMFAASTPLSVKECDQCLYKQDPQGGHCYMFKTEPEGEFCGAFRRAALTLQRSTDDITTEFTRCVGAKPCDANWFRSYKEINKKLRRPLETWADQCNFRGVSINKLEGNREEIKAAYTTMKLVSPKAGVIVEGKYVCTFRMTLSAGKVADTSKGRPVRHYTLLKCDGFDISYLVVVDTVTIEEF